MYAVYSVLIVAFFILVSPYLLYQAVRYRKYIRSLPQRTGYLPLSFNLDGDDSIWIHAVSVGEVLTARALLPELRVTVGHGQLPEDELYRRMHAFTRGEHDLLLATTII